MGMESAFEVDCCFCLDMSKMVFILNSKDHTYSLRTPCWYKWMPHPLPPTLSTWASHPEPVSPHTMNSTPWPQEFTRTQS